MNTASKLVLAVALMGGAVACGDSNNSNTQNDAATSQDSASNSDASSETGIRATIPTDLPAPSLASGTIDLACRGTRTAPSVAGQPAAFTLHIQDFQSDAPVVGAAVKFFSSNVIPADLTGGQDGTTDSSGNVTVMAVPGSWYAYHVGAIAGTVPTVQINELAPAAAATENGTSVSTSTVGLINALLGRDRVPGTAMIAGIAQDCNEAPVQGLVLRAFREDGTYIEPGTATTAPLYAYFSGGASPTPSRTQPYTNNNGLYGAANITIGGAGETVRLETWSREGGEATLVGCEKLRVFADSVAIVNVGPQRADGPTDCSE